MRYFTRDLLPGEIANSINMHRAYQKIAHGEHAWAIMMEDDAYFESKEKFCQMAEELDRLIASGHQWNLVYFLVSKGAQYEKGESELSPSLVKLYWSLGTQAFAISSEYAK